MPCTKKSKTAADNTKLKLVKEVVEAQPAVELRHYLFGFTKEVMASLVEIRKRYRGVKKVRNNDNYVPISVRFQPKFNYPVGLKGDDKTMEDKVIFQDTVNDF